MVKRIISILFLCSFALCSKTTIAIFDFENNGLESYEVRQLSKRLESELVKLGDFDVVERARIDEVLKEQKIQASGCTETCLLDVGKILGATQIVYGSIGKIGDLYTISAKLVDAETGKLIRSSDYDADYGLTQLLKYGLMVVANRITGNQMEDNYQHSSPLTSNNISKENQIVPLQTLLASNGFNNQEVEEIINIAVESSLAKNISLKSASFDSLVKKEALAYKNKQLKNPALFVSPMDYKGHILHIDSIYIDESDFNLSALGYPLNIKIEIWEHTTLTKVFKNKFARRLFSFDVGKKRGKIALGRKLPIKYKPNYYYYLIVFEEKSLFANNKNKGHFGWISKWVVNSPNNEKFNFYELTNEELYTISMESKLGDDIFSPVPKGVLKGRNLGWFPVLKKLGGTNSNLSYIIINQSKK